MKKIYSFLLFMATVVAAPTILTSCGKDEANSDDVMVDPFENLYGYWINADKSGAIEIIKNSSSSCIVNYFVFTTSGIKVTTSQYTNGGSFSAYDSNGVRQVSVKIISASQNKLILQELFSDNALTSYAFTRVTETEFQTYLEKGHGGNNNDEPEIDDAKNLIGTWVGYDGTPGLDWTDKYTITFYSSGKAKEVWSCGDDYDSMSGTYKYSNGKITEWEMEEGSILANTLGDPSDFPWIVTFITPTEIQIGDEYFNITFSKQ